MFKKITTKLAIIASMLAAAPIYAQTIPAKEAIIHQRCVWMPTPNKAIDLRKVTHMTFSGDQVTLRVDYTYWREDATAIQFSKVRDLFARCNDYRPEKSIPAVTE